MMRSGATTLMHKSKSSAAILRENGKSKVGRAKTFRHANERNGLGPDSILSHQPSSMVELLRHRAKSATREMLRSGDTFENNNSTKSRRDHSASGGFVSRLRFLDTGEPQRLRWQDREPSSGYSSGGGRHEADGSPSDDSCGNNGMGMTNGVSFDIYANQFSRIIIILAGSVTNCTSSSNR